MSHCHQQVRIVSLYNCTTFNELFQVLKIMVEGKATGELLEVNDVIKLQYHDPTTTTTTTSSYFSCFDNKGPIDRCSKQPSCDTNNNNNTNTCQQYRFQINKVPSIPQQPLRSIAITDISLFSFLYPNMYPSTTTRIYLCYQIETFVKKIKYIQQQYD